MDGRGGEPTLGEVVGDLLRGPLRAGEDHGQSPVLRLEHLGHEFGLVERVRAVDELRGPFVDRSGLVVLGPDVGRLTEEGPREREDRAGHRGREQHRLPLLGHHPQDALDVGQEAQVEHLVGLVEHECGDLAEHQVALFGEVQEPARCANDHVDAVAQRLDLRLVGASAVDGRDAHAEVLARVLEVLADLHAQLTRGHHDECLRGAVAGQREPLQQRHAEAEGLARSGAGLADDVVAGQGERERQGLNVEGPLDPRGVQRPDDLRVDAELGEGRVGGGHGGVVGGCARRRVGRGVVVAFDVESPLSYQRAQPVAHGLSTTTRKSASLRDVSHETEWDAAGGVHAHCQYGVKWCDGRRRRRTGAWFGTALCPELVRTVVPSASCAPSRRRCTTRGHLHYQSTV